MKNITLTISEQGALTLRNFLLEHAGGGTWDKLGESFMQQLDAVAEQEDARRPYVLP